jgi:hypothetical protein
MELTRTSKLTGVTRTMNLNVTQEQLNEYQSGALIQDVFPHLSASEREFIMTGITDEEWNQFMVTDDDEMDGLDEEHNKSSDEYNGFDED